MIVACAFAVGDRGGEQAGARDDDRGELGETVAPDRVRDDAVPVRRAHVQRDREAESRGVAECAEGRRDLLAASARNEHRAQQGEGGGEQERVDGREREPVDVRPLDHRNCAATSD